MCLLTYFPAGVAVDAEALRNGSTTNRDGHGFAIIVNGELVVRRFLVFATALREFMELREANPDTDAIFHSRYGTCGSYGMDNVHPFHVGRSPLTVLAHNGHIHQAEPVAGDKRVDSRIMAEDIMPRKFPVLDSAKTQRRLHSFIGTYNKLVILTVDPRYARNAYIINESAGIWHNGAWYSNSAYEGSWWAKGKYAKTLAEWDEEDYTSYVSSPAKVRYRRDPASGEWVRIAEEPATSTVARGSYARWWEDAISGTGTATAKATVSLDALGQQLAIASEAFRFDACIACESPGINEELMICKTCLTCQDCGGSPEDCMCYAPATVIGPRCDDCGRVECQCCKWCGRSPDMCQCMLGGSAGTTKDTGKPFATMTLCATCQRFSCAKTQGYDDVCTYLCEYCAEWPCVCYDGREEEGTGIDG